MIKYIEKKPKGVMTKEDYTSLIENVKSIEGKYVVLLKDTKLTIDEKEAVIEKGSLAHIDEINLKRTIGEECEELQNYYIQNIKVTFCIDDGKTTDLRSLYFYDEENKDRLESERDCIEDIYYVMSKVNEDFGCAEEIDTIGTKLDKTRTKTKIGSVIGFTIMCLLWNLPLIIGIKTFTTALTGIGAVISFIVFIGWIVMMGIPDFFKETIPVFETEVEPNLFYNKLAVNKYVEEWKKYDDIITDYAIKGVCDNCPELNNLLQKKNLNLLTDDVIEIGD